MRPLLILLLVWPAAATAQSTSIEGHVVIDGDSSPLAGATIAWSAGARLLTVRTDERGAFAVTTSDSMPQRLAVAKAGFVTQTVTLRARGTANEVRLRRAAIGAGIVRDAEGLPVVNVGVKLQQLTDAGDGQSWTVSTDDRGEFRTLELLPGQYRVHTVATLAVDGAGPISQMLSDAVTVDLRAGETTSIRLTHGRGAAPSGRRQRASSLASSSMLPARRPAASPSTCFAAGTKVPSATSHPLASSIGPTTKAVTACSISNRASTSSGQSMNGRS